MDKAAASFTDWARENDAGFIEKIKAEGWEVLDLTDEERGALAAHVQQTVWPSIEETVGKDIIDRLRGDS